MPKGYFKPFTKTQEQKIKDEYLLKPVKRLADEVGCTYGRIMRFLKNNSLEIPKELIEQRKLDSRKKKGDVPFNKGLKQTDYMTPESIKRTKKTRFQKGQSPKNKLKVGTERITKDVYLEIKVANPNKWVLKQRFVYENHHKVKLKKGEIIIFKDGDNRNFNPTNLKKITKCENMYRNSVHNYPKEIIPSLVLNRKLKLKINTLQNGTK